MTMEQTELFTTQMMTDAQMAVAPMTCHAAGIEQTETLATIQLTTTRTSVMTSTFRACHIKRSAAPLARVAVAATLTK
jgi:hypothetical protein